MTEAERARTRMVEEQIVARGVSDPRVLDAMRAVPREAFISSSLAEFAYDDCPLPIGEGQTISQPYIVAAMVEAARIGPDNCVLDVGTGSGYAAAVMSRLATAVFSIECVGTLAEAARERLRRLGYLNVEVREGDGSLGWPEKAPFDVIHVAAGGPRVPRQLLRQLCTGGRLVIPVGEHPRFQTLLRVRYLENEEYEIRDLGPVAFVPLVGEEGWAETEGAPRETTEGRNPRPRGTAGSALVNGEERLAAWVRSALERLRKTWGDPSGGNGSH